ncbi:CBS domain containing protein [Novymonas esmeraldas]|uniref:CBS domain containing protein n=1 Tax=Novymonas esmeraldas TaxID=1808958 RepID=A0AAW0EQ15_9TRYP
MSSSAPHSHEHGEKSRLSSTQMLWYSIASVVCVVGAGFFVGLQIALFSIDRLFLRVLTTTGTPKERQQAKSLLGVLKLQHWTLVALVLMNAVFVMTLPILLESMFDELTALIVSITAVLFIGEVVPLAVFVRWAIPVCSYFVYAIWFAIVVTAPVSYPMGKVLDRVLGHSEEPLDREDLAALIVGPQLDDNEEEGTMMEATAVRVGGSGGGGGGDSGGAQAGAVVEVESSPYQLRESEVKMLQAAMLLSTDTVQEHLRTKAEDAFMLSSRDSLDRETILRILTAGYSRVPVYFGDDRRHIIGALIVNSLVSLCFSRPNPPPLVSDYPLREVMRLSQGSSLYDAYLAFRNGPSNMAVIYDSAGAMVGLLTLNDVLATLYNADPVAPVTLSEHYVRRQHKMVELVEGMKFLQATKRVAPVSLGSNRLGGPDLPNVQRENAQDHVAPTNTLLPTTRPSSVSATPQPQSSTSFPAASGSGGTGAPAPST